MIDIHSHILPGLDDGARDIDEALAMVRMAAEAGTTDIVATPHANWEFAFDPAVVRGKIDDLQSRCGAIPRIHYGCDFHLDVENIERALAHPDRYTINQSGYLLVEFNNLQIPASTGEIFESLLARGITPIITHPERNPILQKSAAKLQTWVAHGCLIQVTGQSVTGHFGSRAQTAANDLLNGGLVHFLASDGHDTKHRPPVLREVRDRIAHKYGERRAQELLVIHPQAVLSGEKFAVPLPVKDDRWGWLRRRGRE